MGMTLSVERIKRWGLKGGLGIVDQGLYSGANFLLSILLARWLSPEMYGGFSATYSLFLLVSTAQVALIAEPMSIFGADQHRQNTVSYLNHLLRIQWIGTLLLAFLFFLIAFFFTNDVIRDTMIGMAASLPFILFYWYLRRALYIEMQSAIALVASFAYSILLVSLVSLIQTNGHMTSLAAYLAMAFSSLVASLFVLKRLGVRFLGKGANEEKLNSKIANQELWEFGKWILPAYLAGWFISLSFPLIITILVNAQSAGAFRALQNLFLPFQQLLAAITLLALPWLARQKAEYGIPKLFAITEIIAGTIGLFAGIYCLFVVVFRHKIITFLYANEFYSSFDNLVIIMAISTLLSSVPLILGLALRILGRPNIILWSKGCAVIFVFLLGIPMIWLFQMNGVLFSLLSGIFLESLVLLFFYFKSKGLRKIENRLLV